MGTLRELMDQRAGEIRLENAPRMVQVRHQRRQSGYSVIAESDLDSRGLEVGFYDHLYEARNRASGLRDNPDAWMHGIPSAIAIYNVSDLRIVERYGVE